MATPVTLILGAGSNIGTSVAKAFATKGHKIALAARSVKEEDSTTDKLYIRADFGDPASIASVFDKVRSKLGPPHVVVFNVGVTKATKPDEPFSLPLETFRKNIDINMTSAFAAAQQAVLAFQDLPASAAKTFILTGNCLNVKPILSLIDLGTGKTGGAHIIQLASEAYKSKGYKFYYADERLADGSPVSNALSGEAHAELFTTLADGATQGPWQQTFVKGKGYVDFSGVAPRW